MQNQSPPPEPQVTPHSYFRASSSVTGTRNDAHTGSPPQSPRSPGLRSTYLSTSGIIHAGFTSNPDLSRQPSLAQNLIQRYNSLDSVAQPQLLSPHNLQPPSNIEPGRSTPPPLAGILMSLQSPLSVTNTAQLPVLRTSYSDTGFSERNPLKSSFKNIIGALGFKREPEFKAIRYRPRDVIPETDSEYSAAARSTPAKSEACTDLHPSSEKQTDLPEQAGLNQDAVQLLPYDEPVRKSGLLLCLQADSSWLPSLVTLTSIRLRIEPQGDGSVSPCDLSLSQCADVRSLSSKETQDIIISSPFPDGELHYLLELDFYGNTFQRFAAQSITERGSWVSSLW